MEAWPTGEEEALRPTGLPGRGPVSRGRPVEVVKRQDTPRDRLCPAAGRWDDLDPGGRRRGEGVAEVANLFFGQGISPASQYHADGGGDTGGFVLLLEVGEVEQCASLLCWRAANFSRRTRVDH